MERIEYTADWTSGRFVQYGSRIEFRADWANATAFDTLDEARAEFERLVDGLPSDWTCEYNCSNRNFHGGFAAKLEEVTWEWDEEFEEWHYVGGYLLELKIWDGEGWFE